MRRTAMLLVLAAGVARGADPVERLKAGDPTAVEAVAAALAGADRTRALATATALRDAGAAAAPLVPDLRECLLDDDPRLRAAAAAALGAVGEAAAPALPDLARLADDAAAGEAARHALVRLGRPALPWFAERVKEETTRHGTYRDLLAGGAPGERILDGLLAHGSWHVRLWTARLARRKRPPDGWLERLAVLARNDPSGAVRLAAVRALARHADRTEPSLVDTLGSASAAVRRAALLGLARVGAPAEKTRRARRDALADPDAAVRAAAAYALENDRGAVALLRAALEDENPQVARAAAASLAHLGVWDEAVLDHACRALAARGFRPSFRVWRFRRNLRAGGSGPDHARRLVAALERGDPPVPALFARAARAKPTRRVAIVALLGGREPLPEGFDRFLRDESLAVRRTAAYALAHRGDARPAVVRLLAGCLGADAEENPIETGGRFGFADPTEGFLLALGPRVVPHLLRAYEDELRRLNANPALDPVRVPRGYDRLFRRFGEAAESALDAALEKDRHPAIRSEFERLRELARGP